MKHKSDKVELHIGSYVVILKLNVEGGTITPSEREMIMGVVNSISGEFYEANLKDRWVEEELYIESNLFESEGFTNIRSGRRRFSTLKGPLDDRVRRKMFPANEVKKFFLDEVDKLFTVSNESV